MTNLLYTYNKRETLTGIEIPPNAEWKQIARNGILRLKWPVKIEIIHSSGGRIPQRYRHAGDLDRKNRRHSRIKFYGNPLAQKTPASTMILQDDDTEAFAAVTSNGLNDETRAFGQMAIIHHEVGHILQPPRHPRNNIPAEAMIDEGFSDCFSVAMTLAQTRDIQSARSYVKIRSDYLEMRIRAAMDWQRKKKGTRKNLQREISRGALLMQRLDYILCQDAMTFILDEWEKEPWAATLMDCTQIARKWAKKRNLTRSLASTTAVQKLIEMDPDVITTSSIAVRLFVLQHRNKAVLGKYTSRSPQQKSAWSATP